MIRYGNIQNSGNCDYRGYACDGDTVVQAGDGDTGEYSGRYYAAHSCGGEITGFVDTVKNAAASYGLNSDYIMLIFKVVGIAYIIQLAAQICTDAGESAIASKVELAGRVMILLAAAPTAFSILDMILELVP